MSPKPVVMARVLSESADSMIVELIKDEQKPFKVEEGDQFYTMVFTDERPW